MQRLHSLWIMVALGGSASFAQAATRTVPRDLELKCTSTEVVASQPCGGSDSRTIKLLFDGGPTPSSGYREEVSYGGCYSVNTVNFGKVEHALQQGDLITFDLAPTGVISEDEVPVVFEENMPVVPATLNTKTSVLTLNMSTVPWFYQHANTLGCAPLY